MGLVKNKKASKNAVKHSIKKEAGRVNGHANKKTNGAIHHASTDEFSSLKDISGYTNDELATLVGTTHRTIRNKKSNGEFFDIAQTERLRKLTHLFEEGNEIFNNKEEFNSWLQKPAYGLDYDTPSELLKQPGGLDKVFNELRSIKFGDTV